MQGKKIVFCWSLFCGSCMDIMIDNEGEKYEEKAILAVCLLKNIVYVQL